MFDLKAWNKRFARYSVDAIFDIGAEIASRILRDSIPRPKPPNKKPKGNTTNHPTTFTPRSKKCAVCRSKIYSVPKEGIAHWNRRKTCSKQCSILYRYRNYVKIYPSEFNRITNSVRKAKSNFHRLAHELGVSPSIFTTMKSRMDKNGYVHLKPDAYARLRKWLIERRLE